MVTLKFNSKKEAKVYLRTLENDTKASIIEALTIIYLEKYNNSKDSQMFFDEIKAELELLAVTATEVSSNQIKTLIKLSKIQVLSEILFDFDVFLELRNR